MDGRGGLEDVVPLPSPSIANGIEMIHVNIAAVWHNIAREC
jgi:hypothetical protein